ncbi:GNAT family N-acetyltransferase [Mycetocola tolaasinivorans]|uniref:GNAT family N-acetyltransferase n=1 Tax=Mycetocola tolaasinivorans TaxID=76635 RepID=A0A3L7A8P3_9MICO|nr:GNAT family N-acetyltransferase [Mycetocola tolaasinivorans]RLP75742.1 GNAT family N-acetyltransferase [Mycetocola tolaasinivorans]
MNTPALRLATESDIPSIVPLIVRAYRGNDSGWTSEGNMFEHDRINEAELLEELSIPDTAMVLAHAEDGVLVGCGLIRKIAADRAYFGLFAVNPDYQGGGIGKTVLAGVEDHAAHVFGVDAIEMTVLGPRPELVEFYGRRGYLPTGEIRELPEEVILSEVGKKLDMSMKVLQKDLRAAASVAA